MNQKNNYEETKNVMGGLAILALLIGAILIIFGGILVFDSFTSNFGGFDTTGFQIPSSDLMESFQAYGNNQMGKFFIGGVSIVVGFALASFGYKMIIAANIGKISTYVASETSEATSIASESLGSGLARGINKGGGIEGSNGSKETIRIKCRNCGYLETEDADFCSKCGKSL